MLARARPPGLGKIAGKIATPLDRALAERRLTGSAGRIAVTRIAASLESLAAAAGLSPYGCLRAFRRLTGVTPHQYVLRARLRHAAAELAATDAKVIDVSLTSGFGDLPNFNHAFRDEFGVTPRAYRALVRAEPRWCPGGHDSRCDDTARTKGGVVAPRARCS